MSRPARTSTDSPCKAMESTQLPNSGGCKRTSSSSIRSIVPSTVIHLSMYVSSNLASLALRSTRSVNSLTTMGVGVGAGVSVGIEVKVCLGVLVGTSVSVASGTEVGPSAIGVAVGIEDGSSAFGVHVGIGIEVIGPSVDNAQECSLPINSRLIADRRIASAILCAIRNPLAAKDWSLATVTGSCT